MKSKKEDNGIMEHYKRVQSGSGYDKNGVPVKVGHQCCNLGGAGNKGGDTTKHMGHYSSEAVDKGPKPKVVKKAHKSA